MDDNIGTTRLLVHSNKGKKVLESIKKDLEYMAIDSTLLISDSKELVKSTKTNNNRTNFFQDLANLDYQSVNKKYLPNTLKTIFERIARRRLVNFKSYKLIKKTVKRILGR